MLKFKAAILVEQNKPLEIANISLKNKLDIGQVLVKVKYSGLCGSQLGEIRGVKGKDNYLPHLLGHEGSAVVVDIGPGVKNMKIDDKVIMHWKPGLGHEGNTPKYNWERKIVNAGFVTTFNEYAVVSENRITKIPNNYPMDKATLFGCAVTTGLGVIENNAQLKMGQTICIVGAGGIGLNIIQGSALHSALKIVAIDLYDNRLTLAKKLGATHIINAKSNSVRWQKLANSVVDNVGFDVVVDNTGKSEIISSCYELAKPNGKLILVGVPSYDKKTSLNTLPIHFGKKIIGSHGGNIIPHYDIPRYLNLETSGKLNLSEIFTETFKLSDINQAITKMENGLLSGRALIKCFG